MRHSGVVAMILGLVLTAFTQHGRAQDMTFEVEETGQPPAPPAEGPPSEALAAALRQYQQEQYREAAVQFQRVVEGETQDAPGNVQKAQFFLGKTLYHLRFYQAALAQFDEISQQGQAHLYFNQTLQWLAQLASQLPESANIIERVGRYGVDQLEQFNKTETQQLYGQLLYLMGRYQYQQGEFDQAVRLFERVQPNARVYVESKFFEGLTYVRLRRARPAVSSFRRVLEVLDSGETEGVEDEDRMRNLAWLSLARVYYQAAVRQNPEDPGDVRVDPRVLFNAIDAWDRIDEGSEYWLDALFERSWAFYLADEYARSLGSIHTIYSPYFQNAYYPEALVLKAVVFFVNCQIDSALAMVGQFHERYDPVKQELEATLSRYEDNTQFFEFLKRVRSGQADLPPRIRSIVSSALSDRTVLRHLEYVRILEAEEKRLNESPEAFKNSSLGARILQDITVAKSFAIDQAGDIAKARYNRLVDELQDLMNQMDTIELEATTFERGTLNQEMQEQMTAAGRSRGGRVEVDEEHQLWPFDGEYWRDELPFYRQQVTNRCGR